MADEAKSAGATATPYSLDQPLPSEVVARDYSWPATYRNYPVFSAPWFRRRSALFVPVAALIGLLQAALTWNLVDARTSVVFTAGVVAIWILLVTAGAGLATLVRHRRMPLRRERAGVVLAVLIGIAICGAAQYGANRLSRDFLMARAVEAGTLPRPPQNHLTALQTGILLSWYGAVFFVLSGGVALRTYFNESERWRHARRAREVETLRRQKTEAEMGLKVLQAQVEPHFLFNTLASVHSLVRKDPARAEATIEALVDHLRATLPKLRADVGATHSTLAEQLDVCTSYLAVMQIRMGDRLRFKVNVPSALKAHPFPPLVLISLVENAIKHGIEPSASGGCVYIEARERLQGGEHTLEVSVIDDGVGLQAGVGVGVGLANVRAQLAAQFGPRGRFTIHGGVEGGVVTTIVVPWSEGSES